MFRIKLFSLIVVLLLLGCTKAIVEIPEVAEKDKAVGFATDAVLASPEYAGGSALRTTDVVQEPCLGCWKVYLAFEKHGQAVPVLVTLEDWVVQDLSFANQSFK